jgi:hypothetical protein
MATFSIIPGAASNTQLRALLIARDAQTEPTVQARASSGSAQAIIALPEILANSPQLVDALRAARVLVRRIEVNIVNAPATSMRVAIDVTLDGQLQTISLTTLPRALPPEGLSFIVASCFDREFNMGDKLRAAMSSVLVDHPAASFQLWIGDNVYVDVPGFGDENLPYRQTVDRYLTYLLQSSYASARQLHPNFTTYDDHELWNDYPEEQFQLPRTKGAQRQGYIAAAQDCLALFQSNLNLNLASHDGLSFRIEFTQVSFFVADTRTRRDRADKAGPGSKMMTDADLIALENWCSQLTQPGVLVLGQPLWIEPFNTALLNLVTADHNPPFFRAQYERVWAALRAAPFDILILTGDIHYSRLMRLSMQNAENRKVFELVTSPAAEIPTLASTVGHVLGAAVKQDRTACEAPSLVAGSVQKLKAEALFATSSPNSFARVTLRPLGRSGIKVGASFVDYARGPAALAPAERVKGVPVWGTKVYSTCHEPSVCVLRMR